VRPFLLEASLNRQKVYPGQIPLETDILNTNKNTMIGLAKLAAAVLGTTSFANGLACTPNIPADLTVLVAPGEVYSLQNIDDTDYSSLAADTAHQILKQGVLLDQVQLSCPAPGTAGFSINYLVQAAFAETDGSNVVLPYYNASNPSQAWSGMNNDGVPQSTVRQDLCNVTVKAGTAAATGTQTTPSPDAGNVGLMVVTVANGQTTITAGNISQYAGAPFIPKGGAISNARNAKLTKSVAGNSDVTLDASEAAYPMILLTGALTGNINLIVPAEHRRWQIINNTSGNYTVTVKTPSGTGVVLSGSGASSEIYCGGANVVFTGVAGATGAQFDNGLRFATTAFVKQAQGNLSGVSSSNASTTLTLAQIGNLFAFYGSTAAQIITLPDAATVPAGYGYDIVNQASVSVTIKGNGAQNINANTLAGVSAANTLVLGPGDSIYVTSNGVSVWNSFGITASSLAAGGVRPFSVYLGTANQSAPTGTQTKVAFNAEEFDPNSNFDSTTNRRFTPTVAGYYQINWAVNINASSTLTTATSSLYKNGTSYKQGAAYVGPAISTFASAGSAVVYMNGSTDYLEIFGYTVGTSPVFTFGANATYMTGCLLGS
jgi:hypothetical protein